MYVLVSMYMYPYECTDMCACMYMTLFNIEYDTV